MDWLQKYEESDNLQAEEQEGASHSELASSSNYSSSIDVVCDCNSTINLCCDNNLIGARVRIGGLSNTTPGDEGESPSIQKCTASLLNFLISF